MSNLKPLFNKNTGTAVSLRNLGYVAESQAIKHMWISKSKMEKKHRVCFPAEVGNLHLFLKRSRAWRKEQLFWL